MKQSNLEIIKKLFNDVIEKAEKAGMSIVTGRLTETGSGSSSFEISLSFKREEV